MAQSSETTTDIQTIKAWAEARNGVPATVRQTGDADDPGILRILFEEDSKDDLEPIDWDKFFETFEEQKLAFLYQETTSDGSTSRFHKFVKR